MGVYMFLDDVLSKKCSESTGIYCLETCKCDQNWDINRQVDANDIT